MLEDMVARCVVFIKTDSRIMRDFLKGDRELLGFAIHYKSSMLELGEKWILNTFITCFMQVWN